MYKYPVKVSNHNTVEQSKHDVCTVCIFDSLLCLRSKQCTGPVQFKCSYSLKFLALTFSYMWEF